jgi:diacylglycerol kinase (ATP)
VKPHIIFNPAAGAAGDLQQNLRKLKRLNPAAISVTQKSSDAEKLAVKTISRGCNYIIVAGGDGTLNEVINGAARSRRHSRIGLVPLGTGNDFARTLGLPLSIEENIDILRAAKTSRLDIVRVRSDRVRYFVNVSAGGFSDIVRGKITPEIKRTWGPLAYLRGAAAALPKLHAYKTRLVLDGSEEFSAVLYNVVIANGRFVAGGLPIAPQADPRDGLLDVVLIPKQGAADMALLAAEIILGRHLSNRIVIARRVKKIAVRSRPGMWFNADGELVGSAPAEFQILAHALDFVTK